MNWFENLVNIINGIMWNKNLLVILLVVSGIIFTIRTRGVQFRLFAHMCQLLTEKSKAGKDEVSSFQAFCISTASRVGVGNLAGVVAAVSVGGPGSVFWMWVVALLNSSTAFIESTIAILYREKDPKGGYRGGAPYFLTKGLNQRWLGILFVIFALICWGGVFQVISNSVTESFNTAFGINTSMTSLILVILSAGVLFGNRNKIVKVLDKMVPFMAALYLIVVFYIIVKNIGLMGTTMVDIFEHAFGVKQFLGGTFGSVVMEGVKRGLFSNEAGMGSAPNAAATANVSHPVKQGLIQTLGVFTDTLLICSATAFIILISGESLKGVSDGIQLTQDALVSEVGSWGAIFIAVCIFMFAFSSVIGNYYYGEANIEFLNGNKVWLNTYRVCVVGMVMFGSLAKIQVVWDMADLFMGIMAVINLIAIGLLGKISIEALKDYRAQKAQGLDPKFRKSSIPGLKNVECWED